MSVERLQLIREIAEARAAAQLAAHPMVWRVIDSKGNTLQEFHGAEDAVEFNRITDRAAFVERIVDGVRLTQAKPGARQSSESAIDGVLARAAMARGGRTLAEDCEELPDADAAGESDEEGEAA